MKARLVLLVAAALAAAFAAAGCGGGSSSPDPATLAPAGAPVFIEATVRPEGELKTNVESLAKRIAGVGNLGELIVSEAEKAAHASGEPLDYSREVEPWLGDKAGLFLEGYDGSEFHGYGVAVAVTDAEAARSFLDRHAKSESGEPFETDAYEGVDYRVDPSDGTTIGIVGEFLVVAKDLKSFKAAVGASNGESLAGEGRFTAASGAASAGSLANVFVDIGGLIEESGGSINPEAKQFLDTIGIDPKEATALASVVPGSNQIEIDISSDLGAENPPAGDASQLLGALPGDSVAALASADFGKRFGEALDQVDARGIPGKIPPHELKKTMKAAGIDLEKISSSIGNLGVFAEGDSKGSLGGAVVLEAKNAGEAKNTVANVGLLLRASHTPGITAIGGKFSGFSVHSAELGPQPLVVGAAGERIAVAYGLRAAAKALAGGGPTLSSNPAYKEAVGALGGTPISGFVDGPAALRLASALAPPGEHGFAEAKPYLGKIDYVAIGSGASGGRSTVKLVAGVGG
jgi:uncharacterized protein DUF3352